MSMMHVFAVKDFAAMRGGRSKMQAIEMGVAVAFAETQGFPHGFSDLIGFPEYLYQVLLVWLAIAGAGPLSLDKLLAWKFRRS